ncbi:MAG: sigma-70 family RNA polymerase sigma factor [Hyphomicrobium aestuarii]|nr:sigma-70 family RNA polymerase sigma factor [Hyphomicrobium aestuarii]
MATSLPPDFQYQLEGVASNLRAFAMSLTRDPSRADDLVQETLAKAWEHQSRFELGTNIKAWLFTILRNTFLSELRKRKAEVEDPDDNFASSIISRGAQDGHMDLVDFSRALADLPPEQREALLLIGEGYSYAEISSTCGCAVGTVKSRVNRGRCKLRELLGLEEMVAFNVAAADEQAALHH